MRIYEIDNEIQRLVTEAVDPETGELKLDYEALDALQMERDRKVENLALLVKNRTADIEAYAGEINRLTERRKAAEKEVARMREYLQYVLGNTKFETPKVAVSFRKSQKVALEPDFLSWAWRTDQSLLRMKDPEPNKTEIKKRLADGEEIPFASLEENYTMTIK